MNVLILGATGQVGRALMASVPVGWNVRASDVADLDLTNRAAVAARIRDERPDLLINAAAYTAVDRAEVNEDRAHAINAEAVHVMAQTLRVSGGRLVHISTDFVFDGNSARAYRPHDPVAPLSAYGRTKAAGEQAAGADALIVRTAWVFTAGGANFVRTMLRLMRERQEINVVADQIGSPTWAPGLASTLWSLASKEASGIFHHSDAGVASWYDFAVAIQEEALALKLLDRPVRVNPIATSQYPTPALRPKFSVLDCSATRALLGDGYTHWRNNLRCMLQEERGIG